ncbi:hypothetical protein [Eggerthia catenaformis]|uniref:hypothetical protein n=1 Tax=Eggerthia catenaformis TaxID=31973 RepID=UPI000479049B|nr:hypothetical protein [Eggerthia catenaformis]
MDHDFKVNINEELARTIHKQFFSWGDTYVINVDLPQYEGDLIALCITLDYIRIWNVSIDIDF